MVKLFPITQADFDVFLERNIVDYAADKVRSGNWTPEEALERSRQEHQQLLPDGPRTKDQFLFSIFLPETGHNIGMLWVNIKMEAPHREAFIYDFFVEESHRGKGYGKQALEALDVKMKEMRVESVALHVFGFNSGAIELYKRSGFEITNIQMRKDYPSGGVKSSGA